MHKKYKKRGKKIVKHRYIDANDDAITEVINRRAFTSREDIQEFIDNVPTRHAVEIDNDDFGSLIIYSIRYMIGRHSYAVKELTEYICPLISHLTDKTLVIIKQDYERQGYLGKQAYGNDQIDKPIGEILYQTVINELQKRGFVLNE